MGALSENFLKLRGTAVGDSFIEWRGNQSNAMQIGPRDDAGVWHPGLSIDGRGRLYLNPSREQRNSIFYMETKKTGDLGGAYWAFYADADTSIIGDNQFGIWGYPRNSVGGILGSEPFVHFKIGSGSGSGYTKFIEFYGKGGSPIGLFDDAGSITASETSFAVRHNNVYKRVYVGAVDSGGSGFRLLRVSN